MYNESRPARVAYIWVRCFGLLPPNEAPFQTQYPNALIGLGHIVADTRNSVEVINTLLHTIIDVHLDYIGRSGTVQNSLCRYVSYMSNLTHSIRPDGSDVYSMHIARKLAKIYAANEYTYALAQFINTQLLYSSFGASVVSGVKSHPGYMDYLLSCESVSDATYGAAMYIGGEDVIKIKLECYDHNLVPF